MDEKAQEIFRWAYAGLVFTAQKCLEHANANLLEPNDWPCGQQWNDLAGTSKAIFLKEARKVLGIPNDEFLAIVRSGEADVDDLYETDFIAKLEPGEKFLPEAPTPATSGTKLGG